MAVAFWPPTVEEVSKTIQKEISAPKFRDCLPHLTVNPNEIFLTDGGIETFLIYEENISLPEFAIFPLLKTDEGREVIRKYFIPFIELAKRQNVAGFMLGTPTYKASKDIAKKLGITDKELLNLIKISVEDHIALRNDYEDGATFPIVIEGVVGPRKDGYKMDDRPMSREEASDYHFEVVKAFGDAGVDMVSSATMAYPGEAIGISDVCESLNIPYSCGFTVGTDGMLACGLSMAEFITVVDTETKHNPVYYMINCAHVDHFFDQIFESKDQQWVKRIRSIRANPSRLSHEELGNSTTLQSGDPVEFGESYGKIKEIAPWINIVGGCCGTNSTHVDQICRCLKNL